MNNIFVFRNVARNPREEAVERLAQRIQHAGKASCRRERAAQAKFRAHVNANHRRGKFPEFVSSLREKKLRNKRRRDIILFIQRNVTPGWKKPDHADQLLVKFGELYSASAIFKKPTWKLIALFWMLPSMSRFCLQLHALLRISRRWALEGINITTHPFSSNGTSIRECSSFSARSMWRSIV